MYEAETAEQISQRIGGWLKTEFEGLPTVQQRIDSTRSVWYVLRKVLAQGFRGFMLRLEWLHKQRFVSLCDDEYLDLHAAENGLSRQPALYAEGDVDFVTVIGTNIPVGTQMLHANGVTYETVADVTATAALTTIPVRALTAGEIGNLPSGSVLTLVEAIAGVGDVTVSTGGIIGGVEQENEESLRERILQRKRNPPHGGSPPEYIEWSKEKFGVTRVWVKRATPQAGSVTIYFAMDTSGYVNGIPPAADVADLQGILEDAAPGEAEIIVAAPTAQPVNITFTSLVPDTPLIREGITAELDAVFLDKAVPGETFTHAWLAEAVQATPGLRRHRMTVPADDVAASSGAHLPVRGAITWPS